jgi:RHS repeat-associated protein
MVSTETAGNTRIDNRYDALHRRVLKIVSSWDTGTNAWVSQKSIRFTYDGWNVLEEEETTATSTRRVFYTWGTDVSGTLQGAGGVGGLLKAEETIGTAASSHYYWYDGNGNVVGLMRGNGTVDAVYRYSAFGGKAEVSVNSSSFAARNPYRFSTKYLDAEVETTEGTYYYGYRHYATALGRWPSRDPIGERGGENLYAMVGNNPVFWIDGLGLNPWSGGGPDSPGNCWRHACGDPKKPGEPHSTVPPGNDPNEKDINAKCKKLMDGIISSGKGMHPPPTNGKVCCPEGYRMVSVQASLEKIPRSWPSGQPAKDRNGNQYPPQPDFHFEVETPDGWKEKPGYHPERPSDGKGHNDDGKNDGYKECGKLCVKEGTNTD